MHTSWVAGSPSAKRSGAGSTPAVRSEIRYYQTMSLNMSKFTTREAEYKTPLVKSKKP